MKLCGAPGCDRRCQARGLCILHYGRAKRAGTLPPTIRRVCYTRIPAPTPIPECLEDGCTTRTHMGKCYTHRAIPKVATQTADRLDELDIIGVTRDTLHALGWLTASAAERAAYRAGRPDLAAKIRRVA